MRALRCSFLKSPKGNLKRLLVPSLAWVSYARNHLAKASQPFSSINLFSSSAEGCASLQSLFLSYCRPLIRFCACSTASWLRRIVIEILLRFSLALCLLAYPLSKPRKRTPNACCFLNRHYQSG